MVSQALEIIIYDERAVLPVAHKLPANETDLLERKKKLQSFKMAFCFALAKNFFFPLASSFADAIS